MGRALDDGRHGRFLICLLLAAITLAAYWPVLDSGFVGFDDEYYVTRNLQVQKGLTWQSLGWAFASFDCTNWHPITWISHMIDYELYGLNPTGHHLTGLMLHLANVLLLFWVLLALTSSQGKSAVVAALFAVHPLHVESVAWVSEHKDVLSTLFWLLTTLGYTAYARRGGTGGYALVVGLFALGLMAKPMLVSLPIVLLILDWWPLQRTGNVPGRKLVLEKLPLALMAAASCVVTYLAQTGGPEVGRLGHISLAIRIDNAIVSYAAYLGKMIWPVKLAVIYPHPLDLIPTWIVARSGALLAAISVIVFAAHKSRPYLLTGWLWYLVTLVPVIGLVQVGEQAMADRYAYIPLIGIFVACVWGVGDLLKSRVAQWGRATAYVSTCVLIVLLAVGTWVQTGYWHDSVSLFSRAIQVTKNNYVAHLNLAISLDREGELDAAKEHFEEALHLQPDWEEALYNYGVTLTKMGDLDHAIAAYRRALHIRPRYVEARYNLALAYDQLKEYDRAIREYRAAIRLAPDLAPIRNNLAIALYMTKDYSEAWEQVHAAQSLGFEPHPGFIDALSSQLPDPGY